ncbi:circadian clock protein KaiB [uncultured Thiodictyon sp.]|uniref:circadian clock protein KaiB n=1 Tax=uncultured Thiodictyon sp. TaxID=1846217 RepID=UPI0025E42582|nr:circadian clock protein KaiB [uncultured Thiodictyon sp.]
MMGKYLLRLYITGRTPQGNRAIANLQRICQTELAGRYEMEVIDVIEDPQAAEDARIIATPTLIKALPPPLRRIIGDLSNKDKVLIGLDLSGPEDPNGDHHG